MARGRGADTALSGGGPGPRCCAQAARWCTADPLRKKFTKEEKATWSKAERAMYKTAYELGGESRATIVMRKHFMDQAAAAAAPSAAPGGDGYNDAEDGKGVAGPATRKVSSGGTEGAAPVPGSAGVAAAPASTSPSEAREDATSNAGAALVSIRPKEPRLRPAGTLLYAGVLDFEAVGKSKAGQAELPCLTSFHRIATGASFVAVHAGSASNHIVAITPAGRLFAWGRNGNGQLGLGHLDPVAHPAVVKTFDGRRDSAVTAACGKVRQVACLAPAAASASGSCRGRRPVPCMTNRALSPSPGPMCRTIRWW